MLTHPCVQAHSPTILLVTPPPVSEIQRGNRDRQALVTAEYAAAARELAAELQKEAGLSEVVLIDLWTGIMNRVREEAATTDRNHCLPGDVQSGPCEALDAMLSDGLHLSRKGYELLFELLKPTLGKQWASEEHPFPSYVYRQ